MTEINLIILKISFLKQVRKWFTVYSFKIGFVLKGTFHFTIHVQKSEVISVKTFQNMHP